MNFFGLPAKVTWTGTIVVLFRVEIGICDFSYLAGGYYVDVAIYLAARFPPLVVCLQSTRDLLWWLGACFRVGHQELAVWLGHKLVLLLMPLRVCSAQCSVFHRLRRIISQDFVRDFLCFPALGCPHEVTAYGVVLRWCTTCCYVPLAISCLLLWLIHAFSLFCFSPVVGASFADADRIDTLDFYCQIWWYNCAMIDCCFNYLPLCRR
jgi:hypothetical protein